ncbi:MAG: hypothetical protein QME94_15160 [Anaerolineae bacterium]|nr:hypothetical protein [Anaerolineae bacterium]
MGVVRARTVYANLADREQSCAILREAVFDARRAHLSVRAAFAAQPSPPMRRPVLCVRYVRLDIGCLEAALRGLEEHCVPLATPPDFGPHETYSLGIWRPDRSSVQARWGVGTPGPLEALSARWKVLWEQMTDLLQRGEPVTPEELWPLDMPPAYEQASSASETQEDRRGS